MQRFDPSGVLAGLRGRISQVAVEPWPTEVSPFASSHVEVDGDRLLVRRPRARGRDLAPGAGPDYRGFLADVALVCEGDVRHLFAGWVVPNPAGWGIVPRSQPLPGPSRTARRIALDVALRLGPSLGNLMWTGRTMDISLTGIRLSTDAEMEIGEQVVMDLRHGPDLQLPPLRGTVVHRGVERREYGLTFLYADDESMGALASWLWLQSRQEAGPREPASPEGADRPG